MFNLEAIDGLDDEDRARPEPVFDRVVLRHDLSASCPSVSEDDSLLVWPPQHLQTVPAPSLDSRLEVSLGVEHETESHDELIPESSNARRADPSVDVRDGFRTEQAPLGLRARQGEPGSFPGAPIRMAGM